VIGFLLRRLAWAIVVLTVVAVFTFGLVHLVPADPARAIVGARASAETVANIRRELGLNDPLPEQLARYLTGAAHLDLGHSYQKYRDVLPLILERVPATAQLAVGGLIIGLGVGIPLGVLAARRAGRLADRGTTLFASFMLAAPSFVVGYLLLYLLAYLPSRQFGIDLFPIGTYKPFDLRYLALPALTLGIGLAAYYTRLTRTTVLDQLRSDYVRMARSKGLTERRITWRHVFPNAALPLLTQFGLDLGFLLGGIVIIEQVFSWPGVGKLAVEAITQDDVPLIMGTVLFGTLVIVLANLAVDVVYAVLDPRLRNQ
jgi:peptide/nickel transport system permease protein